MPPRVRTGFLTVTGILAVVFGTLVVLAEVIELAIAVLLAMAPPFPGDPATEDLIRTLMTYFAMRGLGMELMSVACIVIGIGLIRHRPIARPLANVWAVLQELVRTPPSTSSGCLASCSSPSR